MTRTQGFAVSRSGRNVCPSVVPSLEAFTAADTPTVMHPKCVLCGHVLVVQRWLQAQQPAGIKALNPCLQARVMLRGDCAHGIQGSAPGGQQQWGFGVRVSPSSSALLGALRFVLCTCGQGERVVTSRPRCLLIPARPPRPARPVLGLCRSNRPRGSSRERPGRFHRHPLLALKSQPSQV